MIFFVMKIKIPGINYLRRGWVEDKFLSLSQVFSVDVNAYAVMGNSILMILFVDE